MTNEIDIAVMRARLAEIGIHDVPDAHLAQWKSAQQSLDAALARLPRDLSWSDEPFRNQSSGR
jgi:hypothetical protein